MKKAVIYNRVSDAGQLEGQSLEVQQELCAKWARQNGYQAVGVYTDAAKTGTKTVGRDALDDMIIRCQDKSDHIDAVLVIDTDRIARNEIDHFFIKNELRKGNTQLIAINQPMINDTPEGQFFETILAGTNAFYSRLTGRKVKKTLEKKCHDGNWPGMALPGYLNHNRGTKEKPDRVVVIDPEKAKHITKLFKLFSTDKYSVDALRDILYKDGLRSRNGKKVARSSLYAYLKNPFYIGKFIYKGEQFDGNHDPLTTPTIFDLCQKIMAKNNHNACRRRKYKWLLTGLVYCHDCGSRFYCSYNHKKRLAYYHGAYRKGCREYIHLDLLEEQVASELKKIKFSEEFKAKIREKAKDLITLTRENRNEELQSLRNKVKALEAKRNVLEDSLLDGTIDKEMFKRKHAEINIEIQGYENDMANIENQRGFDVDLATEVLDLDNNLYETYQKAVFEAKRHYLSIFFDKIEVYDKKIRKVTYAPLFQKLLDAEKVTVSTNWLPREDSNL